MIRSDNHGLSSTGPVPDCTQAMIEMIYRGERV